MNQWSIPLFDSDIEEGEIDAVVRVLKSQWLTMGDVTKQFEQLFSEEIGCAYAFAMSSGTTALHLAHAALGIGPGDEVIVPSLTFVATVNSILYTGATPVFADIASQDNLNVSPKDIEKKMTPRTKAIVVLHYAGYPCEMNGIMEIAEKHNLFVIEDAAHAPGAQISGKSCGTFGHLGCFSFFSNKNIATGEGGMIVTNDEKLAKKIPLLRSHGMTTLTLDRFKGHAYTYDVVNLGYNYRISEIASALGIVQLKKLSQKNAKRKMLTKLYAALLENIPEIIIPFHSFCSGQSSYHIFPVILGKSINRNRFMQYMKENGIQTSIHYPPVHKFSYYKNVLSSDIELPVTEDVASREVTLPLFPGMEDGDVEKIASCIKSFVSKQK
jgi:dTDP-4-amino-4,6-dideoxygalactose transaminase